MEDFLPFDVADGGTWLQAVAEYVDGPGADVEPAAYAGDTAAAVIGAESVIEPTRGRRPFVCTFVDVTTPLGVFPGAQCELKRNAVRLTDTPTPAPVISLSTPHPIVLADQERLTLSVAEDMVGGGAVSAQRLFARGAHVSEDVANFIRQQGEAGWTGRVISGASPTAIVRTSRTLFDAGWLAYLDGNAGGVPTTDATLVKDGREVVRVGPSSFFTGGTGFDDWRRFAASRWDVMRNEKYTASWVDAVGASLAWFGFAGRRHSS